MNATILANTDEISREDWLALRKLGSSDAAAICGLNPYRSKYAVWAEICGLVPPFAGNEATDWGTILQPVVLAEFAKRNGLTVEECSEILRHPEHEWMTCTPDARTWENGEQVGVEAKCTSQHLAGDYVDGLPDAAHVQAQHRMAITGERACYVVALIGGNKLVWHRVERDDEVIAQLIDIERSFWQLVHDRTPPPLSESDKDVLSAMYPEATDEVIELPADAEALIAQYEAAKERIAEAEKQQAIAANTLRALLGTASEGRIGDKRVSWKNRQRKEYTVKASSYRHFEIRTMKGAK